MDRFDAISAFVAVVDQEGFTPAARKLGHSGPTITRLVAGLEQHLGVRLLNRTTRSVTLTDAGSRFLARARGILSDLQEAETIAENDRSELSGRLSITAPLIFGRIHVAPLVCQFMMAHPKVGVELRLNDRNANFVEDQIDLAVRIGELRDTADVARKMGVTRRVLVASPAYLQSHGVPATPTALTSHKLISFEMLANPHNWRFLDAEKPIDVRVKPTYVTNSADAAIWHASHGGGITFALSYQVSDLVSRGELEVILADFEPHAMPIHFVYPSSRLLSAKVRALIDLGVETCAWNFDRI